ncbi:IS630 family transposase [Shewanella sp. 202IG2-18]|uniref:IS630 family transposase n=1 Tax=Parashewanella hymeniacidonis TaxID=2807618 RepID=UPI00195F8AF4|nr:IS630 family transposase [Parashewanella hymeniacidonis]MBM7073993.1 IS630 family transposase [Parashewanella hymeniacidonis]
MRLLTLSHVKDGASNAQAARYMKVSRRSVNNWVKRFKKEGIDGLKEKPRSGRRIALSNEQLQQLKSYVLDNNIKASGGRLKASLLIHYIKDNFDVEYKISNIYRLLHHLDLRWITSRSRHPKQSEEVQETFKKIQNRNDRSDLTEL